MACRHCSTMRGCCASEDYGSSLSVISRASDMVRKLHSTTVWLNGSRNRSSCGSPPGIISVATEDRQAQHLMGVSNLPMVWLFPTHTGSCSRRQAIPAHTARYCAPRAAYRTAKLHRLVGHCAQCRSYERLENALFPRGTTVLIP